MTFPPEVWDGVLRRLQKELAPISFEMWLPQIAARPDGDCLELLCPTQFHSDRIRDYFLSSIADCVQAEFGRRVPLRVSVIEPGCKVPTAAGTIGIHRAGERDIYRFPEQGQEPTEDALLATNLEEVAPVTDPLDPVGIRDMVSGTVDAVTAAAGPRAAGLGSSQPRNSFQPQTGRLATRAGSSGDGQRKPGVSRSLKTVPPAPRVSNRRTRETMSIGKAVESTLASASVAAPASATAGSTATHASSRSTMNVANRSACRQPGDPRRPNSKQNKPRPQTTFPLTFESFTVGSCNALAREAALALANQQQMGLNQLFIVSGAGLGKTHLSRAVVGTAARSIGDKARYTTAESFTNEFTLAVRGNQMPSFKRRYRTQCELLVVEDVQFLEGKAATQLEFFHVVQHVLDCGGRVLLTGDKYPQELNQLDERVRARITAGFVAQVDAPDAAVRRDILRAKAAHGGVRLPDDCLTHLVESVEGNVRELEGALIQLVTMASLFKRPIDLELTRESLEGRSPRAQSIALRATPADIIESVAVFFRTSPAALASRSRRRDVLVPRQLAMYLCRRYTEASLADIGRALNRDHPSVANAIRKIERQLLENVRLRYQAEALIARLAELGHRPLHSFD